MLNYYPSKISVLLFVFSSAFFYCGAQTTWEHNYGYFGMDDNGQAVIQSSDGNYIAAGYVTAWGAGGKDVYVVKTDTNGHLIWQNVIGGAADDIAYGIVENSNGELYV